MTTRIPISADPSGLLGALAQIRDALARTGQEARKFEDLDLSKPELKDLADDISRVQRHWQQYQMLPNNTLRPRLRATGQEGAAPWQADLRTLFPSEQAAKAGIQNLSQYLLPQTRWEPTSRPTGSPQGRQDESYSDLVMGAMGLGRGGQGGGAVGGLLGRLPGPARLLGIAGGLAGVGSVIGAVGSGVRDARANTIEADNLYRRLNELGAEFESVRESAKTLGRELGLTSRESMQLTASFARASGITDQQALSEEAEAIAGLGRGLGMEPQQAAQILGPAALSGTIGPQGQYSAKELAVMIGETIARGDMFARAEDVMIGVSQQIERIAGTTLRSPEGMEAMLAMRGVMYDDADNPALRGAAGEELIRRLEAAIRNPGGGEAGEILMRQAAWAAGVSDPFQARYLREAGPYASAREVFDDESLSDQPFMEQMFRTFDQLAGRLPEFQRLDMLANWLGTSMHQAQALTGLREDLAGSGYRLSDIRDLLGEDFDLGNLDPTAIGEIGKIATADPGQLEAIRQQYLSDENRALSDTERADLTAAGGEDLRELLARMAAREGMIETEGKQTRDAMAELANAFEAIGEKLLPAITDLTETIARGTEGLDALLNFLGIGDDEASAPLVLPDEAKAALKTQAQDAWGDTLFGGGAGMGDLPELKYRLRKDDSEETEPPALPPLELQSRAAQAVAVAAQGHQPPATTEPIEIDTSTSPWTRMLDAVVPPALASVRETPPGERWTRASARGFDAGTPEYRAYLAELEQRYGLSEGLLPAMMRQESRGRGDAVSPAGARGLFQFMPGTARDFNINPWDPYQSAEGAARYMDRELDRFGGNTALALAAYNAGPGNVLKYDGIPPFRETRQYVPKILNTVPEEAERTRRLLQRQGALAPGAGASADRYAMDRDLSPTLAAYGIGEDTQFIPAFAQTHEHARDTLGNIQSQEARHDLHVTMTLQDPRATLLGQAEHDFRLRTPNTEGRIDLEAIRGY